VLQDAPMYAYIPAKDVAGVTTGGGAKAAWFKDSEGNIMALIQSV
jgi:hypothetical protein